MVLTDNLERQLTVAPIRSERGPPRIVPLHFFFFQAEDGIRDLTVTGVQTCALPIWTVLTVNVTDNQWVEPGALLFQIDPADYKVAVERAKADLADAVAAARGAQVNVPVSSITTSSSLSTAEAGRNEAAAGIEVAGKAVAGAEARLQA